MSINVACSILGCTNPVIGQCTGYKKNCGKYYCHIHSSDTLCAECTSRKTADDDAQLVYNDYLKTAEGLETEARTAINTKAIYKKGAKIVATIGLIAGPILFPIFTYTTFDMRFSTETERLMNTIGSFFLGFVGGPFLALYFYTIFIGSLIWAICGVKRGEWHQTKGLIRAKEIDNTKPGFLEFYTTWRKEKSREKLNNVLAVAGVVAAIGVAAAVSESDYDRTRRAVRDEMNKN